MNFGYYIFGKDMKNVNLTALQENGVTDIFLNYYAFTANKESEVLSFIEKANKKNINVHIWVQCFYDGEWHNPKTTDLNPKLKEIKKYANMKGVKGVHLDYLRYAGNAYKTKGGTEAITAFVKKAREQNPKTFLSCAVMPENKSEYFYGQDVEALGKIVDAILPMQYKGNYNAGTEWLKTTTKTFSQKATIWSALQTYKSDDNPIKLLSSELETDIKTCLNNGAKGVVLFRYGLSNNIDFNKFKKTTDTINWKTILNQAEKIKTQIEKDKTLPTGMKKGETLYQLAKAVTNPNKAVTKKTVADAPNPSGNNISKNLTINEYQTVAKNTINWINDKGTAPNYTTFDGYHISVKLQLYAYSKIINFFNEHNNTMPRTCWFKHSDVKNTTSTTTNTTKNTSTSTSTNKKYGRSTAYGCNNRGQNNGYYCGPHMVQEIIRNLTGKVIPQSTLANIIGTTTSGSDHNGIDTAFAWFNKQYGYKLEVSWKNFSDVGFSGIKKILESTNQDCGIHELYRNTWGHYTNFDKVYDNSVDVHNSLGDYCSDGCYCGYTENRSRTSAQSYINGISQKSVIVVTRK